MSTGLANIDGTPLHVTLYTTWDFRFLSKGVFRVGKQILSFFVVKMF